MEGKQLPEALTMDISAVDPYFDEPLSLDLPAVTLSGGVEAPYTGPRTRKAAWYFLRDNPCALVAVERCRLINGQRCMVVVGLDGGDDRLEYWVSQGRLSTAS